jgi:arabinose-5-phosphate isomerase
MTAESQQLFRDALAIEADAIRGVAAKVGPSADRAVELLLHCAGRVIVTGMGKMGLVGRKIAATLASTGTPAVFLHPAEAYHGDLGIVTAQDVVLALSNSGQTEEVVNLLPHFKRLGTKVLALTGRPDSTLGGYAEVTLDVGVQREACPLDIAPTASTTAALAMGDALAAALTARRGFTRDDYAIFHPGGSLGRKLLLTVADLMHTGQALPLVAPDETLREAIVVISNKRLGTALVADEANRLLGVFTDGDLRRLFEKHPEPLEKPMREIMTASPKSTRRQTLAAEALRVMEDSAITALPVVDDGEGIVGVLHIHDLLRAGLE